MEQQQPRSEYIENFEEILGLVEYNDQLVRELQNHSNREYLKVFTSLKDKNEKDMRKGLILLEFTRERSTCDEMIAILDKCGQTQAAESLKKYNTSPKFWPFSDEIKLEVTKAKVKKSGNSKYYGMEGTPKGRCIVINNLKTDLEKESLRFEYIFQTLGFTVELEYDLSAQEIEQRLKALSKSVTKDDQSLIVMTISHGADEKIEGIDGSELSIVEIVDYFNADNCKAMDRKPKIFIFNCCRIRTKTEDNSESNTRSIHRMATLTDEWMNKNKSSLICYACAEGSETYYTSQRYTQFGQALSHCIAQYSCEKSMLSILNLTCDRMPPECAPEMRSFKMTKDLYLNPGL